MNAIFCLTIMFVLYLNEENFTKYVPSNQRIISVLIFILVEILIQLSLSRRRWHDIGKEGWDMYRSSGILVMEGQKEENKYGNPPPPKIDFKGLFGF
jgi:uncharacterized membrane protein YhaH (DUF805 family)